MQKSEMPSSSALNDEKPGSKQSAFWWLIGLATLLLLGSAWIAWKQPPNPDANRTAAPGWINALQYPIEQNAFKRVTVIDTSLEAVFALDQRVWAVGSRGLIVHSEDGGKSWNRQTSGYEGRLRGITFHADGQQGWAAGDGGTILKTVDGGKSWGRQTSGTQAWLRSITFQADGQQGWATGQGGTILKTVNGGKSWQPQTSGTERVLLIITFQADGQQGWAAGDGGTILKTVDGGKSWDRQTSGTQVWLTSITFHADGQQGWTVGSDGTILKTVDGGKSWQPQTSGANNAVLTSITFHADGQQGWVAGDVGTILKTVDGGKTWQAIAYRFYPAPWFYEVALIALLIYAAAFWWRARQIEIPPVRSVSGHAATDKPVNLGEPDYLGARRIAAGLTRYLTNKKTEPPLTLAITGDWGSGKSSLMNYLFASLRREGLRPVWFNAWHHREEQNVLASILARVHRDAIKPWSDLTGFSFRIRLLWRQHWLGKLILMIFGLVYIYI